MGLSKGESEIQTTIADRTKNIFRRDENHVLFVREPNTAHRPMDTK